MAVPLLVSAQSNDMFPGVGQIVPQCGTFVDGEFDPCTFCDFNQLIQNLLNFALFLAVVTAGGLFAYVGWLFITSEGGPQKEKAKKLFLDVFVGLIIVVGAYVIVDTLMKMLVGGQFTSSWNDLCPSESYARQGRGTGAAE